MERITRVRAGLVLALFCIVLLLFGLKLYDLQILKSDGQSSGQKTFITRTTVKAARGELRDCNGNPLVTNRASYDLVFNHYVICSAAGTNDRLMQLVQVCREKNISYTESFPVSQTTPFVYTHENFTTTQQGYFQAYLPKVAGGLDSDITAPLLMRKLREHYRIPDSWSDEDARAVIGLRYELDLRQGDITNLSSYVFITDADSDTLASVLELNIPGLRTEASTVRVYNTEYAAHILGYLGAVTKDQWQDFKNLKDEHGNALYSMDALVGQDGLEEAFELTLHAVDGLREDETAVDGTVIRSRFIIMPKAGNNVELSIDLSVQAAAEQQLEALITELRASGGDGSDAEGGAVVVMNVKTGQILACASYPTYNLSTFREDYNDLLQTDFDPLFNRALQAQYPPGSTYKMSMVIAGIHSGVISSYTKIEDKGVFTKYASSGFTPTCLAWSANGRTHEHINAMQALQKSCNYFFYDIADRMTIDIMDETAKGLGLGEKTGIELFERTGYRANAATKALLHKDEGTSGWYPADQISASIGQSDNRFTPLQLCVYTCTLANRGVRYKATFLNRVLSSDYGMLLEEYKPQIVSTFEISDDAYFAYTQGMRMVAIDGTAGGIFGPNYPVAVAAKTGTAQTDKTDASDNGAFVCYAPFDDPEIAVVVYGEKAGHGTTVAQIAKGILDAYFHVGAGDSVGGENQLG